MKALLQPLMWLAWVGLGLSLVVHVSAVFGQDLGWGKAVWGLHTGAILIYFPAVFVIMRATGWRMFMWRDLWKVALQGCPPWMRKMTYGFFGYAILNFILFMWAEMSQGGSSASETLALRGFSGHWMAFYSAALAVYYSASKTSVLEGPRRCGNGHEVSPTAKHCEECGVGLNR